MELTLEDLYTDEVVQIQFDRNSTVLQLTFKVHPDPEQFRNAYRLAIDTASLKRARFWLTDARQIKVMLPENQAWLVQKMAPLLTSHIQKFAIVMAPECYVMTSPAKVYEKPEPVKDSPSVGKIKVHFEEGAAYHWLLNG